MEIAREPADGDLEVFALSLLGRAEVSAGRRDAGMRAARGGDGGRVGRAGAQRPHARRGVLQPDRRRARTPGSGSAATEWCELVDEFARRHEAAPLLGACRTIHADMLLATGHWPEAEHALESALATHARYIPQMGAPTVAALAELRVRQGRLADAERLLAGREEHPRRCGRSRCCGIAEGRPRGGGRPARARAARHRRTTRCGRGAAGAAGRRAAGGAATSTAGLQRGGGARPRSPDTGIRLVRARADLAAARVAVAAAGPRDAAEPARRALAGFSALAMPLDAGAGAAGARPGARAASPRSWRRRGAHGVRGVPRARRRAGDGRRRRRAARARRRRGWPAAAGAS